MTPPEVSVIIPAKNEAARIDRSIARIFASVRSSCEVIVVVDSAEDPTWAEVRARTRREPRLRCLIGGYGPGPANAIRYGIDHASAEVAVVTMADNSDDPRQIDELAELIRQGACVAAASRYAKGGGQIGGPLVKGLLSRLAGTSLRLLARAGTRDATNSYKAYSAAFVREAGIDSREGFAIGIELVAKARRLGRPVAEIPTVWLDRDEGESAFRALAWMPSYLRWYLFCFGRRLTPAQLTARRARRWQDDRAVVARDRVPAQRPAGLAAVAPEPAAAPARAAAPSSAGPSSGDPSCPGTVQDAAQRGQAPAGDAPAGQAHPSDWAVWHIVPVGDSLIGRARGAA
jgi:dolichol-phosphate mannosyltransferase